jgi:UDP-N-acetylmuramate dehydrogenase
LRHDEPLLLVGLGSNLLVRDGGFDGTAIFTHGALNTLRREEDGSFYAEAGVASPKLARFAGKQGCAEAEFLAGIPGTVGGALAMNAGCHGGETWRYVERVLMLNRVANGSSAARRISPSAIATSALRGHRRDLRRGLVPLSAGRRRRGARKDARAAGDGASPPSRCLAECRIGVPQSARRPCRAPDRGRGPQGRTDRGAQVSEKHANFIVNRDGKASASAIEMLIGRVQAEVAEKFGISLVREVRIVGDVDRRSGQEREGA